MNKQKKFYLVSFFLLMVIFHIFSSTIIGYNIKSEKNLQKMVDITFNYYDKYNLLKESYYLKQRIEDNSYNYIRFKDKITQVDSSSINNSGPMDSAWPTKCHDNRHTGRSPYSTENVTRLEKWRFKSDDGIVDGMLFDNEDIIYFGDKDRNVYAVYPNGTMKWKYHTDGWITSSPALAEDGTLYVGSWDDRLYAFNSSTGAIKWKLGLGDTIDGSPIIADDGTIYIGIMGPGYGKGRIWAINPNGTKRWYYDTGDWITGGPAIGDDGSIYIGSNDNYLYALNPNGTLKWWFKTGHYIKGPPSIADDGTVYVGSWDDYLYALYPPNGKMKWKCKVGAGTETNPSIAEDGTIYVGGDKLWAINPNGTKKWTFDLGEGRHIHKSCPAISADGTIYVGTNIWEVDGGDIVAVNPNGKEKWRKRITDLGWIDSSPSIAKDGTVYIGSQCEGKGYLHAFGPVDLNSPPETPTISGKTNGNKGERYWYEIGAVDPDNNPVSLYLDWNDGDKGWTMEQASGEIWWHEHTWNKKGNYTIRVKAKDTLGAESDWATLDVTMPKTKQSTNWWFLQFLEKHPKMFPILRQFLGL